MNSIATIDLEDKWVKEVDFSERLLAERWNRVREDFWGDLKRETVEAVKKLLESTMAVQVQDLVGCPFRKHNLNRTTYRNGYYRRGILTSYGYIASINVPRVRSGETEFSMVKKYHRRAKDIDRLILGMFLSGVSTRRVEEVLTPLLGPKSVSAGLVSKITKVLNKQVEKFHRRQLSDKYEYLILDGIYLNTKSPVYKKRRCVLVAYGLWTVGNEVRRELIDFQVASHGESQIAWEHFLNGLYSRGLEGKILKLVTMDGNKGLYNAVNLVYPNAMPQLCWAHKLRNVANKLPRKFQSLCISDAREIYSAENYSQAKESYRHWYKVWHPIAPEAVECIDRDIEDLLNFYQCPKDLWVKLRTTNIIERVFREVRRRTRPMSCFQNRESVERIIYAIFHRLNRKWGDDVDILEDGLLNEITQDY